MQPLRTEIAVPELPEPIGHGDTLLSVGSCFSEHMGLRLKANAFRICLNPSGILYNPASIARTLRRLNTRQPYTREELFEHAGLWRSFDHHTRFAGKTSDAALEAMNAAYEEGVDALAAGGWLIVTFGTAFAWFLREDPPRPAANCHTLPQDTFTRRLLTVDEIVTDWTEILEERGRNGRPQRTILTVSPVRHLRHDATENQVSKATLILACNQLASKFETVHYFPAYGLMMDDLRDYRFYERDMVHPNDLAQDYIWERFAETCLDSRAREFLQAYAPIRQAMAHRITQPDSVAGRQFAAAQLRKIEALASRFPDIPLSPAREHFSRLAQGQP